MTAPEAEVVVAQSVVEVHAKEEYFSVGQFRPPHKADETVFDSLVALCRAAPERRMLGTRKSLGDGKLSEDFVWMTRGDVLGAMSRVAEALRRMGLPAHEGLSGILAPNRPEFVIAQHACYFRGLTPVPLYTTLGQQAMAFILGHAKLGAVFCAGSLLAALSGAVSSTTATDTPDLRHVILLDRVEVPDETAKLFASRGISVAFWDDIVAASSPTLPETEEARARPDGLFLVLYTSGTTGMPKGVMLPHRLVARALDLFLGAPQWKGQSVDGQAHLSYLPLAHSVEQETVNGLLLAGAHVGFLAGPITTLFDDIAKLKPVLLVSVPRVWKRFQEAVLENVSHAVWPVRFLFNHAVSAKLQAKRTGVPTWLDWDKIALHKVAERLGGNVRFIMCGGAAIDPDLAEWVTAVTNIPFYQGYGLTESFAVCCVQADPSDGKDSVGAPTPGTVARLVDVPDMRYFVGDSPFPRGEIQLRGDTVFPGYWRDPAMTAQCFVDGGWFATGDIGRLNPNGTITIIDRKKSIFKLAQGEYVAVEFLENVYGRADGVSQIWIYGDSQDNFLVAIVVPNMPALRKMLKGAAASDPEVCSSAEARAAILASLQKIWKSTGMQGFERIKAVALEPVAWMPHSGLLTPSLKLKREVLREKYSEQIKDLRAEVHASAAATGSSQVSPKIQFK